MLVPSELSPLILLCTKSCSCCLAAALLFGPCYADRSVQHCLALFFCLCCFKKYGGSFSGQSASIHGCNDAHLRLSLQPAAAILGSLGISLAVEVLS